MWRLRGHTQEPTWALPFTSLGGWLNHSEPQVAHMENKDPISICFVGCLWKLNEILHTTSQHLITANCFGLCGPGIRLADFLWLWFQSVCPLMPSYNTYPLTWISLTLEVGYLFMAAPAKHSRCYLPWMRGISSCHPSWPWMWSSSSRPSCNCTANVPWTGGCSSRPLPLTSGVG